MTDLPEMRVGPGGESQHWYLPKDGETQCAYEIVGANGKWRSTNLRDARKWGLLPSVSKITRIEAAPGLEKWKRKQMMLAALTHPLVAEMMDHDDLFKMLEKDASQQAKDAAAAGTAIHKVIEQYIQGQEVIDDDNLPYIDAAHRALNEIAGRTTNRSEWGTEKAVSHAYGFGGRCDLYSENMSIVADFKSKEFGPDDKPFAVYPNQGQALAAYREALGMTDARCFNIFISRTHPGLWQVVEHTQEKLSKHFHEFISMLYYWQVSNGMPLTAKPWELSGNDSWRPLNGD